MRLQVTERYNMDGKMCRCRRRDFRRGGCGETRNSCCFNWQDMCYHMVQLHLLSIICYTTRPVHPASAWLQQQAFHNMCEACPVQLARRGSCPVHVLCVCCHAGGHEGRVQVKSPERLQLRLSWGDPWGGTGTDEFFMPHPDRLHVTSTINVGGKSASYTQVYKRKGSD